jgi:hypothetical protein
MKSLALAACARLAGHLGSRTQATGYPTNQDLAVLNLTDSLTRVVSNGSVGRGFRLCSKRDAGANPCPSI